MHSCGVAILFRSTFEVVKSVFDSDGRFVMGHFKYHGLTFGVVCIYAPNNYSDRNECFHLCIDKINLSTPSIICGDFNSVFDRSLDRRDSDASDYSHVSTLHLKSVFGVLGH